MSDKRFVLDELYCYVIQDNKKRLTDKQVVDLLNEQQSTISRLEEENEQLRQFINKGRRLSVKELMDNINENELLKKKIRGLEKENEQLKQEVFVYKKAFQEQVQRCSL